MRDKKGRKEEKGGGERKEGKEGKRGVAILQPEQEGRVDAIWNLYMANNSNAHHHCIP